MKVAIVSPASKIKPEYVEGAVDTLEQWGFDVVVMPHALGEHGSFSGTYNERISDFIEALLDPSIDVILCSRGGYGCVHLLEKLDAIMELPQVKSHPKQLVGFSDVSALHALWCKHGLPSIHASMTKALATGGPDAPLNRRLLSILRHGMRSFSEEIPTLSQHCPERHGIGHGLLVGGNLAVLGGLIGTPYNPIQPGRILLIEDIAEPIYKVERILYQLRLAGIFDNLHGLIVGRFTDYVYPTVDHQDVYQMIARFLGDVKFPVVAGVDIGHVDSNIPLMLNRMATLEVEPHSFTVRYD